MKTIGFVCEGPRDSDMLEAVVRHILGEEIYPLYLQPESSLIGENGNGWKGVWTWCVKSGETFDQFIEGATPRLDMIINVFMENIPPFVLYHVIAQMLGSLLHLMIWKILRLLMIHGTVSLAEQKNIMEYEFLGIKRQEMYIRS